MTDPRVIDRLFDEPCGLTAGEQRAFLAQRGEDPGTRARLVGEEDGAPSPALPVCQ